MLRRRTWLAVALVGRGGACTSRPASGLRSWSASPSLASSRHFARLAVGAVVRRRRLAWAGSSLVPCGAPSRRWTRMAAGGRQQGLALRVAVAGLGVGVNLGAHRPVPGRTIGRAPGHRRRSARWSGARRRWSGSFLVTFPLVAGGWRLRAAADLACVLARDVRRHDALIWDSHGNSGPRRSSRR